MSNGAARAQAPLAGFTPVGRIGPNAIIQTNAELLERVGLVVARSVLRDAGLERSELSPPTGMVAEDDVRRLFIAVEHRLPTQAAAILHAAGGRTARYLLANRIPKPAQWVMRRLPPRLSARILVNAIRQNAWTFAGSGSVTTLVTPQAAMVCISACPVCRGVRANAPRCDFHAGTLNGLAAELLGPQGRAREVSCIASGARHCAFALEWSERRKGRPT